MRFEGTSEHVAGEDLRVAVNAAIELERPLFVKSELGIRKKPPTSELLSWIKRFLNEDVNPAVLRERAPKKLIPPSYGACRINRFEPSN